MENETTSSESNVNSGAESQHEAPAENAQSPVADVEVMPTEGHAEKPADNHHFDPVMGQYLPTVNFLVFALLAYFFLRNPIRKAMKSRRESYLKLFADAQNLKAEAEKQAKEVSERYGKLAQEIEQILANASKAADEERKRIILEAETAASQIKREAERIVATELAAAKVGLQQEIMASAKAEIMKKMTSEFKGELAEKYSRSLVSEIAKA
jgi:F-type H+-transporting ATPase subunit b